MVRLVHVLSSPTAWGRPAPGHLYRCHRQVFRCANCKATPRHRRTLHSPRRWFAGTSGWVASLLAPFAEGQSISQSSLSPLASRSREPPPPVSRDPTKGLFTKNRIAIIERFRNITPCSHASLHMTLGSQAFRNITRATRTLRFGGFLSLFTISRFCFMFCLSKSCEETILPLIISHSTLTCGTYVLGHLQPQTPLLP
jgi:hypothetical protein